MKLVTKVTTAIAALAAVAMLASCGSRNEQWEYKVVKVAGNDADIAADFGTLMFADQTAMLNKMGKEGWELVSAYTETGTAFPNFVSVDIKDVVGDWNCSISVEIEICMVCHIDNCRLVCCGRGLNVNGVVVSKGIYNFGFYSAGISVVAIR